MRQVEITTELKVAGLSESGATINGESGYYLDTKRGGFFKKDDNGIVFMADAHDRYIKETTYISLNEFSQYFKRYAEEMYNGRKERKRKGNEENAKSCICGIKWKEDFNNDL